jgi:hypothetical protein
MANPILGPSSWIRLIVFTVLVAALAAVPVRGCARSEATPAYHSGAALGLAAEAD